MVVVFALVVIFVKVAVEASKPPYLMQLCKDTCAASKWCETGQEGVFSYTCHRQTQRHNRTVGTASEMKCKACKSVFESLESLPRRGLQEKEDKKKQNVPPRRQGYKKLKAGITTFSVKRYTKAKTWRKALEQCQSDGGTLVKMDTRLKYQSLSKYGSFVNLWIGLKDLYDNDTFFWIDGGPLTFTKWQRGEPDHRYNGRGSKENCATLSITLKGLGLGWTDQPCDRSYQFLCEV